MASKRSTFFRTNGDVTVTHRPLFDSVERDITGKKMLVAMDESIESCNDAGDVLTIIWKDGTVEVIHYNLEIN